jgi:predicted Holliday junction resolvase-like endonuclease
MIMALNILELFFHKTLMFELILSEGWAIFVALFIILTIWVLIVDKRDLQKQLVTLNDKLKHQITLLKEQELIFNKKDAELKLSYQSWALTELEKFKKTEISNAASILLQKWKIENEFAIRQDAINRSYSVNLGKITEHLIPFHLNFPFNPKDARFIGSPIDMIVFDGHSDKRDEIIIYIVEIKTGNSKLTDIQRKIKEATLNGNIRWAEINPDLELQQSLKLKTS